MRRHSLFVALVSGAMLAVGCGLQTGQPQASSSGGLAVLDLDLIAQSTGRTKQINAVLETQRNSFNQQLTKAQQDLAQQIDTKKKEYGDAPTPDQQKELDALNREALTKLAQGKRNGENYLVQIKGKLIADFRAECRPIAQEIAASKGLSVVIPKNEGFLLSVDPGVDITADVLRAYQTRKPAPSAPAAAPAQAQSQQVKPPAKPAANTAAAPPATDRQ
jgi:Skp family chaperone for outer membrane proteins